MAKSVARKRRKVQKSHEESGHIQATDGQLIIVVQGGPHDGKTIHMDAMLVKLACEEVERSHQLKVMDGAYVATPLFVRDLDQSLQQLGYPSSPAIAMAAWIKVNEYFLEIQKKTSV